MTAAVIDGTFADFKIVKTRAVAQFIIEVPLGNADEGLRLLGGLPQAAKEVWVAVARIQPAAEPLPAKDTAKSDRAKERWQLMGEPEQAVAMANMMCKDPKFQEFREWTYAKGATCADPWAVANWIRRACGIKSRSELASNPEALKKWQAIVTQYELDTGRLPEQRG